MAAFPRVTVFLLVSITGEHAVLSSGFFKPYDPNRWPKPPCGMYYPPDIQDNYCPDVTAYVCSTLGHTYKNECFFCVARWEYGSHIKFDKYGKCFEK